MGKYSMRSAPFTNDDLLISTDLPYPFRLAWDGHGPRIRSEQTSVECHPSPGDAFWIRECSVREILNHGANRIVACQCYRDPLPLDHSVHQSFCTPSIPTNLHTSQKPNLLSNVGINRHQCHHQHFTCHFLRIPVRSPKENLDTYPRRPLHRPWGCFLGLCLD